MTQLNTIEGIGYVAAERLQDNGVTSVEALLEVGRHLEGRKKLAQHVGVTTRRMTGWVNRADLARVKGIGSEYADLLEAAGVCTVPDLAQQASSDLHKKLQKINRLKKLVRRVPSQTRIDSWILLAKELPAVIES